VRARRAVDTQDDRAIGPKAMVCNGFAELVEDDVPPGPTRWSDPLSSTECRSSRHVASRYPVVGKCSFRISEHPASLISSRRGSATTEPPSRLSAAKCAAVVRHAVCVPARPVYVAFRPLGGV
jgi:hypothetical protein